MVALFDDMADWGAKLAAAKAAARPPHSQGDTPCFLYVWQGKELQEDEFVWAIIYLANQGQTHVKSGACAKASESHALSALNPPRRENTFGVIGLIRYWARTGDTLSGEAYRARNGTGKAWDCISNSRYSVTLAIAIGAVKSKRG